MKSCRFLYLLLAASLLAAMQGMAQTALTSLHGTISDQTGAVVPGAHISITNPETGFTAERISDVHGDYAFEQITPGKYTILALATGFSTEKQTVELLVNQARSADFKLLIRAANTETVEVVDTTAGLSTTDATIGTPFDTAQIQSLPFEGNNVLDLLSLQAGGLFLGDKTTPQKDTDSRDRAECRAWSDSN